MTDACDEWCNIESSMSTNGSDPRVEDQSNSKDMTTNNNIDTDYLNYPFMAVVVSPTTSRCAASIVNKYSVLTALHCVMDSNENLYEASGLTVYIQGESIKVENIIYYDGYEFNGNTWAGDLCLLILAKTLTFNDEISHIYFPWDDHVDVDRSVYDAGQQVTVIGKQSSHSSIEEIDLTFSNPQQCEDDVNTQSNTLIVMGMVCTHARGSSYVSKGFSGGPVFIERNNKIIQLAIVSFSPTNTDSYDVHVDLPYYKSWFDRIVTTDIQEFFYLGNADTSCLSGSWNKPNSGSVIDEMSTCETAASAFDKTFKGRNEKRTDYIIGCYYWSGDDTVYFNQPDISHWEFEPLCKDPDYYFQHRNECPSGKMIKDFETCYAAASSFNYEIRIGNQKREDWLRGCFYHSGYRRVYWNHPNKTNRDWQPICEHPQ